MPQKTYTGKLADPEFRRERARRAAQARNSLDAYVDRVVADAPKLNDEQLARLALIILRGKS